MAWVEVGDTDIHYIREGRGRPLVLLHGNSSCAQAWFQQFERFADSFSVIAYDSVNHGHSSNSHREKAEPDRADELDGFLQALGIERPILAGNSMGGFTLLRWAIRHPDAAAALIPSGIGLPPDGANGGERAASRPAPAPLDQETLLLPTGAAFTDEFVQTQPLMYERYLRIRSTATRIEALRHPRRPTVSEPDRPSMAGLVGSISSPMLVVMGEHDRLIPVSWAERLHQLVPHSEYRVIAAAPHNVYYEAAEEYNEIVAEFLARV
jgi:pimeloyl-ACP methyl ester carboxylesterase